MSKKSVTILLDAAVKFPRDQENVIEEILNIIRAGEVDLKHLKIMLKFYRSLHPITTLHLERRLFASGILTEEDLTKPCISSFLTGILFEIVTASSNDCAEYCSNVWLERVEALQKGKSSTCQTLKESLPNPLDFINKEDFKAKRRNGILSSFQMLSTEERLGVLLELKELIQVIPTQFHPRVVFGLFIFLELCESFLIVDNDYCCPELDAWVDTWMHLLASSLLGKFEVSQEITLLEAYPSNYCSPVHHILCGLLIATEGYKTLKSNVQACKKIVKGLEHLMDFTSGVTTIWLNEMKFYFG